MSKSFRKRKNILILERSQVDIIYKSDGHIYTINRRKMSEIHKRKNTIEVCGSYGNKVEINIDDILCIRTYRTPYSLKTSSEKDISEIINEIVLIKSRNFKNLFKNKSSNMLTYKILPNIIYAIDEGFNPYDYELNRKIVSLIKEEIQ